MDQREVPEATPQMAIDNTDQPDIYPTITTTIDQNDERPSIPDANNN
jgi:hypothetical protein